MKITSNGKILNYEVVDLVESYNFHIKFASIQVQKNYKFSRKDWTPTAAGHVGRSLPPSLGRQMYSFAIFFLQTIYFSKKEERKM
jgi:hypothetical protein